jgi:hypothetical protein
MRLHPYALLVGGLVLIAAVIAAVVIMSGGDDDPAAASPGTTPTATRVSEDDFGPAPQMTEHITDVTPPHAETVQRRATGPGPDARFPSGICAEVSYQDLPENNQWFGMAVDGEIVTPKLDLYLRGTQENPEGAAMCYAPDGGLEAGVHDAAVIMRNPANLSGPAQELVAWKFEVIE